MGSYLPKIYLSRDLRDNWSFALFGQEQTLVMNWRLGEIFGVQLTYIFGKELVKGLTVTAVASVATYGLLLVSGIGWVGYLVVVGGTLIVSYFASKWLNALDESWQQKGIIPKNEDVR